MSDKERLINIYVNDLNNTISNLKQEGRKKGDIFDEIKSIYAVIVASISNRHPDMTLQEIEPITKIYTDLQKEYLGDL